MIKYVVIVLLVIAAWIIWMMKRYANPYKLTMVFGKKGAGKTTLLTKMAIQYVQKGYRVFSNVEIFGTYILDPELIGFVQFPPNSVILIDEVSLIWDNRNFKNFKPEVARYFRLLRHYRNICIMFSQNFDIDKKVRDLCDEMYLASNIFGFLSVARKIKKTPTLHQPSKNDSGERTQEGFITENFTFYPPSTWIWTYIPRYVKFFNSFEIDEMKKIGRIKYRFLNEPYLYKLTHFDFYIKDLIHDQHSNILKYIHMMKHSFNVSDRQLHLMQNHVIGA